MLFDLKYLQLFGELNRIFQSHLKAFFNAKIPKKISQRLQE